MKQRLMAGSAALAALIVLGGCVNPGAVNTAISDGQSLCGTVAADTTAAHQIDSNANAVNKVASDVTEACDAINTAAANEGALDLAVAYLDGLWEDVFGTNTPAAATATPAAAAAPAATATPAAPATTAPAATTSGS